MGGLNTNKLSVGMHTLQLQSNGAADGTGPALHAIKHANFPEPRCAKEGAVQGSASLADHYALPIWLRSRFAPPAA